MLQVFLNDLSITDDDCALEVATQRLQAFVATLRAVGRVSPRYVVNSHEPFSQLTLGRGHPLAALRNTPSCTDERVYLKTVADRYPWKAALEERPPDPAGGAEYRLTPEAPILANAEAIALGLAHDLVGLAVSLPTDKYWEDPHIPLVRSTLDADANFVSEPVSARNACGAAQVDVHAAALAAELVPAVTSGVDMWERRAELFPNLKWAPCVQDQIVGMRPGDPNLAGAAERLCDLDKAIGDWRQSGRPHPAYPFSVVPESRRRINEGLCDRRDQAGVLRRFSDHARFGPDENRIHFILETEPVRHALIGHVGRKLGIG